MTQKKKQKAVLESFMESIQEQPNEPKIAINRDNLEIPDNPMQRDEAVPEEVIMGMELDNSIQENIKKLDGLDFPPGKNAPSLTPEEIETLKEKQAEARNKHRGRPLKWSKTDANGHSIREDGYRRTSMIVNIELSLKMKEIAFREGMTEKEVLEQAMRLAVESYERKNGVLTPTDRNKTLFS